MPTNYSSGKIYKIVDLTNDNIYIGSTCEPTLARRLAKHVSDYKCWKNGNFHFVTSFKILENGNYDIQLIEKYPCSTKDELHAREGYYIKLNECVNKVIMGRIKKDSDKNYYENHREQILEKKKIYSKIHKLEKKEYDEKRKLKKVVCQCGVTIQKAIISKHVKTKFHQQYEQRINFIKDQNADVSDLLRLSDEKAKAINQAFFTI